MLNIEEYFIDLFGMYLDWQKLGKSEGQSLDHYFTNFIIFNQNCFANLFLDISYTIIANLADYSFILYFNRSVIRFKNLEIIRVIVTNLVITIIEVNIIIDYLYYLADLETINDFITKEPEKHSIRAFTIHMD